jgi:hypothetical protein
MKVLKFPKEPSAFFNIFSKENMIERTSICSIVLLQELRHSASAWLRSNDIPHHAFCKYVSLPECFVFERWMHFFVILTVFALRRDPRCRA